MAKDDLRVSDNFSSSAATVTIDPIAQELLRSATATAKNLRGLHTRIATTFIQSSSSTSSESTVDFQKPNRLRFDFKQKENTYRLVSDGTAVYRNEGATSQKVSTAAKTPTGTELVEMTLLSRASVYLSGMLNGVSPAETLREKYGHFPGPFALTVMTVPERTVGSQILSGVKLTCTYTHPRYGTRQMDDTLWFTPDHLLYEARTNLTSGGKKFVEINETLTDFNVDPTFASGTFTVVPPKIAPTQVSPSEFDPRLKAGAAPIPFAVQSLTGQTINPVQFKGKVLVLDFWATWCGPCVAALPELQATYNKYHAQGLEVVGVSLDSDKNKLEKFIKARRLPWPQMFDGKGWDNAVASRYGLTSIPFMLVVGRNGKIVAVQPEGHLDSIVKAALAAK